MSFVILGHRGMGPTSTLEEITPEVLPENSLAAFEKSFELGADGIEFDVHLTRDGELAVIHHRSLNKKVAGADRGDTNLGLTTDFNLAALEEFDIGNGHQIPSLRDTLDLIVAYNEKYRERTGENLTIDIEFKGEGTVAPTYDVISEYIEDGRLNKEDFIFNSFNWERLEQLRGLDSELKVMPAITTSDLFGDENVEMPGWKVKPGTPYSPAGLKMLADFHERVGCHAFDCIIFDLRPEMIDFCEKQGVGLFTSTSSETIKASEIKTQLALMMEAKERLKFTGFRADDVAETRKMLDDLTDYVKYMVDFGDFEIKGGAEIVKPPWVNIEHVDPAYVPDIMAQSASLDGTPVITIVNVGGEFVNQFKTTDGVDYTVSANELIVHLNDDDDTDDYGPIAVGDLDHS